MNKVILMGNLTRDPELRSTNSGTSVVDIGLASNRRFSSGGEKKEETTFVDVTFWGKQAEIISEFCKKGKSLIIEGRLSLESWQDAEGAKKSKLKVIGENFEFVNGGGDKPQSSQEPKAQPKKPKETVVDLPDDEDDDIPF